MSLKFKHWHESRIQLIHRICTSHVSHRGEKEAKKRKSRTGLHHVTHRTESRINYLPNIYVRVTSHAGRRTVFRGRKTDGNFETKEISFF